MNAEFRRDMLAFVGFRADSDVTFNGVVAVVVARAKQQIRDDIAAGRVPATVRSFAELHDHVDANAYGEAFDWSCLIGDVEDERYVDDHCRFWNAVQSRLDEWIRGGFSV